VNDGFLIEVRHGGHDAIPEFLFGRDADVAQDRAGELGEETLDRVELGTVLGREGEFEAAGRLLRDPGSGRFHIRSSSDGHLCANGVPAASAQCCHRSRHATLARAGPGAAAQPMSNKIDMPPG
jgi:hypothetical protein